MEAAGEDGRGDCEAGGGWEMRIHGKKSPQMDTNVHKWVQAQAKDGDPLFLLDISVLTEITDRTYKLGTFPPLSEIGPDLLRVGFARRLFTLSLPFVSFGIFPACTVGVLGAGGCGGDVFEFHHVWVDFA